MTTNPGQRSPARTPDLSPRVFWAIQSFITLGYVAFCLLACRRKPLWFDELFTTLVEGLGGPADVWSHLRAGMDNHPPLGYLLGNLCVRVLGVTPLAVRLPPMVAFGVGLIAVYRFTSRRAGQVAGLLAMVLMLGSAALPFAVEARGYALVVGFSALAAWAWQSASEPDRSPWSLLGLGASVAAAIWTHYYAVLLFVPFGVGELFKLWQRRRVDWGVWLSLALAALTFVPLYRIFIRTSAAGFASHFWAPVASPIGVFEILESLFQAMGIPLIALILAALAPVARPGEARVAPGEPASDGPRVPAHEMALAVSFFGLPAAMWVMARLVTNAFVYRYVLFAIVGGTLALALAASRLWAEAPVVRRRCAAVFLAWLPVSLLLQLKAIDTHGPKDRMIRFTQTTAEALDADVVMDSNFDYLQYHHYGPAATRSRVFHLVDAESQLRFNDDDTMVHAFAGLSKFTDIQVIDRAEFLRTHHRFVLISSVRFTDGWILPSLVADKRATVSLVREEKPLLAYLVTYGEP